AIIGDEGINKTVPENFWEQTKENMLEFFRKGHYSDGIIYGITEAGEKLKAFFPHQGEDDVNELSDEISFGGRN
ncbi:TPM domain-containing protein, partial [Bacteroidales bacterium OttesenSCG-928-C19]|nr:TPM domain-containing protein [Bacteroidales bacterium OttesenSCG-928-C19]